MQNFRISRFIPFILSQDMLLYFYEGLMEHNKNHMDQSETFKGVFKQNTLFLPFWKEYILSIQKFEQKIRCENKAIYINMYFLCIK